MRLWIQLSLGKIKKEKSKYLNSLDYFLRKMGGKFTKDGTKEEKDEQDKTNRDSD